MLSDDLRNYFDEQLEHVLAEVPPLVHDLLEEVPLVVEDYPSPKLLRQLGLRYRDELCGLYTGVPLTDRNIEMPARLSDVVHLFREGILSMSTDSSGQIDEEELRRQIRITLLHELGHHHGFDEDQLRELGY